MPTLSVVGCPLLDFCSLLSTGANSPWLIPCCLPVDFGIGCEVCRNRPAFYKSHQKPVWSLLLLKCWGTSAVTTPVTSLEILNAKSGVQSCCLPLLHAHYIGAHLGPTSLAVHSLYNLMAGCIVMQRWAQEPSNWHKFPRYSVTIIHYSRGLLLSVLYNQSSLPSIINKTFTGKNFYN